MASETRTRVQRGQPTGQKENKMSLARWDSFAELASLNGSAQESVKVRILRGFLETRTLVFRRHPTTTFAPKWAELRVSLWK
jgi:hypothetical protein